MNRRRRLVGFAVAVSAVAGLAAPAVEATPNEQHCLIQVVGQATDGQYLTTKPVCFDTLDEVAARLGRTVSPTASAADAGREIAALSSTIGVHYDGANFTGSSITVSGSNCAGGYVNLTVAWRNRISSTINGCPQVRFYNLINLGGSYEPTFASGNLNAMNNLADSIQYRT